MVMDPSSITSLVQSAGYSLIFLIMIIEGPIITFIAAFASSLGYFNPGIIFLFSVLTSLIPDLFYYWIGRAVKKTIIYNIFKKFGINKKRIVSIENKLRAHSGKMMITVKVLPGIPPLGLTAAGMVLPFKRFFYLSVIISVFYTLFFFITGFYAGKAYDLLIKYFKFGEFGLPILIVLIIFIWIFITKFIKNKTKIQK